MRTVRSAGSAILLVWCLTAAISSLWATQPSTPSPIPHLDAEFSAFATLLPARGVIGFLDRYKDGGTEDAVRAWFSAQYALTPRVLVSRVGPEFLIVAQGAAHPEGDSRLGEYVHVDSVPGGHRLYRRVAP
jgi:hypothetical protein